MKIDLLQSVRRHADQALSNRSSLKSVRPPNSRMVVNYAQQVGKSIDETKSTHSIHPSQEMLSVEGSLLVRQDLLDLEPTIGRTLGHTAQTTDRARESQAHSSGGAATDEKSI